MLSHFFLGLSVLLTPNFFIVAFLDPYKKKKINLVSYVLAYLQE